VRILFGEISPGISTDFRTSLVIRRNRIANEKIEPLNDVRIQVVHLNDVIIQVVNFIVPVISTNI
jgi:hypothetical protein